MTIWLRCACLLGLLTTGVSAQSPARWRLVEIWRQGGAADGVYAFDDVTDVKAVPGGRLVVLDHRSRKLTFYDSAGRAMRSFAGKGNGPGELNEPRGIAVAPTGAIAVNDPSNSRIVLFSASGEYLRDVHVVRSAPLGYSWPWDATFDRSGRLLASVGLRPQKPDPSLPFRGGDSTLLTERWSTDFARSDSLSLCGAPLPFFYSPTHYRYVIPPRPPPAGGGPPPPPSGGVMFPELPFTAQSPVYVRDLDGAEWAPRSRGSGELVRRASGRCDDVIARIVLRGPPTPIPSARRDEALRDVPAEQKARVPTTYPWFHALRVDDTNRLWVERDVAGGRRFEVFSAGGQLLAEVDAPSALVLDDSPYARVVISGDRLYGFVEDANDVRYLVAWRIIR